MPKCGVNKRSSPPGQHTRRGRKISEVGIQLKEKQRAKYVYGMMERQLKRYFGEAARRPGKTGETLLQMLELRLDNVVYRLGFADSRNQARQIVRHGHIRLNGHKADIPSLLVKSGDAIAWKPESIKLELYKKVVRDIQGKSIPGWLSLDMQNLSAKVLREPSRDEIETNLNERLIVEYYAR